MEPARTADVTGQTSPSFGGAEAAGQLSRLFGSYRAEALRSDLFELFSEPAYFRDLTTSHSCILQGGRGSGKTTVLKTLSFTGQEHVHPSAGPETWPYFGLYYRVNPNRTAAFKGPELDLAGWTTHFAHYLNLVFVLEVLKFLRWYDTKSTKPLRLPPEIYERTASTLNLEPTRSLPSLIDATQLSLDKFEAYINNVGDGNGAALSLQGAPVDALLGSLREQEEFRESNFFLLLDEFEKLEDYQQVVVNTLIKQSGSDYCFKVAVRELGMRTRETLSPNEYLVSPADYSLIDVDRELEGEPFREFARAVCNQRLSRLAPGVTGVIRNVEELLPGLTEEQEALELGAASEAAAIVAEIRAADPLLADTIAQVPALEITFIRYWSTGSGATLLDTARECAAQSDEWSNRLGNYQYASLFALKRGKRGMRKYYSGWPVFVLLAGGNIRYLMQLVDRAMVAHLKAGGSLTDAISPKLQTEVAQSVGLKALTDLSGLSIYGAQVTKLQLGLGRLYGQFAADPEGHTPEVNQFSVIRSDSLTEDDRALLEHILAASVMDLALRWAPGTKPTDAGDTRAPEYWPHPIFSPYFVFSHRKKRRMDLSEDELLGLLRRPKETIRSILARTKRDDSAADEIPEQLVIFEAYYSGAE